VNIMSEEEETDSVEQKTPLFTLRRLRLFCIWLTVVVICAGLASIYVLDKKYEQASIKLSKEHNKLSEEKHTYALENNLLGVTSLFFSPCEKNFKPAPTTISPTDFSFAMKHSETLKEYENRREKRRKKLKAIKEGGEDQRQKNIAECESILEEIQPYTNARYELKSAKWDTKNITKIFIVITLAIWPIYLIIHLLTKFIIRFREPLISASTGALGLAIYLAFGIIPLAIAIALGIWIYTEILR
jgi:hypothetical protein